MERNELIEAVDKVSTSRVRILEKYPFFGRLLMRMGVGFEDCETAYTDMKRVVFDPKFVKKIADEGEEGIDFLFLHELMHCVLMHCIRGRGKCGGLYNIACDIVVNSLIMETMGDKKITVLGECEIMHLAPDGKEGSLYTADEVYEMLKKSALDKLNEMGALKGLDSHSEWEKCTDSDVLGAQWERNVKEASKAAGNASGIPAGLVRVMEKIITKPKINWRQVLQDFIRHNKGDYTFCPPDRRFSGDFLLPSYVNDIDGSCVEKLWFAVDASASVDSVCLSMALNEIRIAIEQLENLSGYLSFFDTQVTEPVKFEDWEDVKKIPAVGGGGTSFINLFESLKKHFKKELPSAIIILTDGEARYPAESAACGVPVIWLMVKSNVVPPWGEHVVLD